MCLSCVVWPEVCVWEGPYLIGGERPAEHTLHTKHSTHTVITGLSLVWGPKVMSQSRPQLMSPLGELTWMSRLFVFVCALLVSLLVCLCLCVSACVSFCWCVLLRVYVYITIHNYLYIGFMYSYQRVVAGVGGDIEGRRPRLQQRTVLHTTHTEGTKHKHTQRISTRRH